MKKYLWILLALQLSGCAAMVQEYQRTTCNYDGAYEKGVNDATAGKPLSSDNVVGLCEESKKTEASRGYREGYMTIKKNPVIQIGTAVGVPSGCYARPGSEAHQGFCAALNNFTCSAHSLCMWR